ncbi:hypothetical protein MRB53_037006 [Persea americana]|nr:hypothetical protein MRB53_037006 [Persea americana]
MIVPSPPNAHAESHIIFHEHALKDRIPGTIIGVPTTSPQIIIEGVSQLSRSSKAYLLAQIVEFTLILADRVLPHHRYSSSRQRNGQCPPQSTLFAASYGARSSLNASVGGKLHAGYPVAKPCYLAYNGSSASFNLGACSAAESNKTNGLYLASTFGGYEIANWATCQATDQKCVLNNQGPDIVPVLANCYQGSVPNYYIDVRSVSDVQAGFAFAKQHSLPLVIKNTGHDWKGRSSAPNSLALWTHNIRPPMTLTRGFVPAACSAAAGDAITFGSGVGFVDVYEFAQANNVMMVGGAVTTVGVGGGWLAGGGHSVLSPTMGLGVDNVLQLRAVLPNGRSQPHRSQQGFGGYLYPTGTPGVGFPSIALVTPQLSLADTIAALKPITDFLARPGVVTISANISTQTFYQYFNTALRGGYSNTEGLGIAISSRLIPMQHFANATSQSALVTALQDVIRTNAVNSLDRMSPLAILFVGPVSYALPASDLPGGPGASSATPAWRISPWHVVVSRTWDPVDDSYGGAGSAANVFRMVSADVDPLRRLAADGGAYQNEADTFEPDYIDSFWGRENYEKLSGIKNAVDPGGVLMVHQGIGWDSADARFACYPSV